MQLKWNRGRSNISSFSDITSGATDKEEMARPHTALHARSVATADCARRNKNSVECKRVDTYYIRQNDMYCEERALFFASYV